MAEAREHKWRAITVQDVLRQDHPSVPDGELRVIPDPEGENETMYGCKVCGEEMGTAVLNSLPCAGEDIDGLLHRWAEDLVAPEE